MDINVRPIFVSDNLHCALSLAEMAFRNLARTDHLLSALYNLRPGQRRPQRQKRKLHGITGSFHLYARRGPHPLRNAPAQSQKLQTPRSALTTKSPSITCRRAHQARRSVGAVSQQNQRCRRR